jgi:predicted tellurium resistance membrane protein TerC
VLTGKLPAHEQGAARRLGLAAALVTHVLLLLGLTWLMGLTRTLFTVLAVELSGRDLILLAGGHFLFGKAAHEIHGKLGGRVAASGAGPRASFALVIAQIGVVDVVFSLDAVITAVGMAQASPGRS